MSGYLPGKSKFKLTEGHESIPVMHCHGTSDPVVKIAWAEMTKEGLTGFGVTNYELRTFNSVGHTITLEIIANGENFLKEILVRYMYICICIYIYIYSLTHLYKCVASVTLQLPQPKILDGRTQHPESIYVNYEKR